MGMNEEILLDIKVQDQDAIDNINKLTQANALLKAQLGALDKTATDYGGKSAIITSQIKENTAGIRENSKELKTNAAAVASADTSINGMRARVADLQKSYNSLSSTAREGDVGKAISSEMKSLNEGVNSANKSVSNFKDNIGNYPDAMSVFGGENTKAGKSIQTLGILAGNGFSGIGKSLKELVAPFKAVIVQMWAMVANPIGIFISAIVIAFGSLYLVFKNFKPVVDGVEQSVAGLGAAFDVIKNSIATLFSGTKSLSESFSGLGGSMRDAAKAARELKAGQQILEDSEASLEVRVKRNQTEIQRMILQSKNRSLSEKERMELIDKAIILEAKTFWMRREFNDKEVKQAQDKIIVGKNMTAAEIKRLQTEGVEYARLIQDKYLITDEEIINLKDKLIEREDIRQEDIALNEKAMNRRDVLADAAIVKEEKRQAKNEADNLKRIANQEKETKKIEEELKKRQDAYSREYETRIKIEKQLETAKVAALKAIDDVQKEFNDKSISTLDEQAQRRALMLKDNYDLLMLNEATIFDAKKQALDEDYDAEIKNAEKIHADTQVIKDKYKILNKKLDDESTNAKLDQAKIMTDGLVNLFGKATIAGKLAASASVAIDTYKGAQSALATMGSTPIGMIMGIAQAAIIVAGGVKAIADINAVSVDSGASTINPTTPSTPSTPSTIYTNLPNLSSMYSSSATQTETAQVISGSQPSPVVRVTEITNMQNTVKVKENSKL